MLQLIAATWKNFLEDNCTRTAASLAYSATFSMAPILVLIISIGQYLVEPEDIRDVVQNAMEQIVGNAGVEQLNLMVDSAVQRDDQSTLATVTGILLMLVGATGFFAELQGALNEVWNVKPDPKKNSVRYFLTKRILSLGMVLTLGLLTLVSVVASSAIASLGNAIGHWMPRYMEVAVLSSFNLALSFCLLTGLFAAMYRVLPDAEIAWRDVFVGAAVTATLFILGESIITLYLSRQNIASLYGAAGSLIVLLTWVYYSTLTLLFGAELTYAWASTRGARTVPSPGAMIADKESEPSRGLAKSELNIMS